MDVTIRFFDDKGAALSRTALLALPSGSVYFRQIGDGPRTRFEIPYAAPAARAREGATAPPT